MKLRGLQEYAIKELLSKNIKEPITLALFPRTGKSIITLEYLIKTQEKLNRKLNVLVTSSLDSTKSSIKNDVNYYKCFSYNTDRENSFKKNQKINIDNFLVQSLSDNNTTNENDEYIPNKYLSGNKYDVIVYDEGHTGLSTSRTKQLFKHFSKADTIFLYITGTPDKMLLKEELEKNSCVIVEEDVIFKIKNNFDKLVGKSYNNIPIYESDRSFYENFKHFTYKYFKFNSDENYSTRDMLKNELNLIYKLLVDNCIKDGINYITFPDSTLTQQNELMELFKNSNIPVINTIGGKYVDNKVKPFLNKCNQVGIVDYYNNLKNKKLVIFVNGKLIEGTTFNELTTITRFDVKIDLTRNNQLLSRLRSNTISESIYVNDFYYDRVFDIVLESGYGNKSVTKQLNKYITNFFEYNDVISVSINENQEYIEEKIKINESKLKQKLKYLQLQGGTKIKRHLMSFIDEDLKQKMLLSDIKVLNKIKIIKEKTAKLEKRIKLNVNDESIKELDKNKKKEENEINDIVSQYINKYVECFDYMNEYINMMYVGYIEDEIKKYYKNVIIKIFLDTFGFYEKIKYIINKMNECLFDEMFNIKGESYDR